MSGPTLPPAAQALRQMVAPWAHDDAANGHAWSIWAKAAASPLERAFAISQPDADGLPGIGNLLDPDTCPDWALRYCALAHGARVAAGLAATQQRDAIRAHLQDMPGTPGALIAAARTHLVSSDPARPARVRIVERDGGPDDVTVITYTPETPNPPAVNAALQRAKAPGLWLTHVVADSWTYGEIPESYSTYDELAAAFDDYDELAAHLPD